MSTTRNDSLHNLLSGLRDKGVVTDWFTSGSPRKWNIWAAAFHRSLTIREAEIFAEGLLWGHYAAEVKAELELDDKLQQARDSGWNAGWDAHMDEEEINRFV